MNTKYLKNQGEPEAVELAQILKNRQWDHYIAIPCCGEHELLPGTLDSLDAMEKSGHLLVFLLINEGPDTDQTLKQSNQQTLAYLQNRYTLEPLKTSPRAYLGEGPSYSLLVLDRTGDHCFPPKKGVGLARKIGADIGLALFQQSVLKSPWIHNTDSDARLPVDYLSQLQNQIPEKASTVLHRYRHVPSSSQEQTTHWQAAMHYESWLRYYVLGLRSAGSPWAFPTIGSTISIHAPSYAAVHGFPKRQAGEDFYLLNKLAKVGEVYQARGQPVILQDRRSHRVPFGTGQGTQKIETMLQDGQPYMVYHPASFIALRCYLNAVKAAIFEGQSFKDGLQWSGDLSLESDSELLNITETESAIKAAKTRARTLDGAWKQFHHWFDAFRTLKFIHLWRDKRFGELSLKDALSASDFWSEPVADLPALLERLRHHEETVIIQHMN
ncbi:hypothetical protein [Pseudobacteriovorax antillogorgiicola]|uniref:Glycosyl transferase family 2 n=1 Tax=Pseudobacteriovorax antillogorgiicola TaxID=1513793 RepID=A0A1Y6BWF4_9BACT|nr:hypothetical protein [Pseudobacteriovorax antillogorgiicola]TCS50205.1 hypothetical protein EDD56_11323 [Pseudobacteriovorax antillogorgiicola]SMF32296.1 hypothetical protein SAMN06296036_11022 [Pseudobacteriovorax antillogorgiicola]